MSKPAIICIDDQRDVLAAVKKDLVMFEPHCELILCESADEAMEVLEEKDNAAEPVAILVCDHLMAKQNHRMPGENGVDFLARVHSDSRCTRGRKILLTGMATHKDTIIAINQANIDRYIEKPWDAEDLQNAIKILFTQYLLQMGMDYQKHLDVIDQQTLMEELHERG